MGFFKTNPTQIAVLQGIDNYASTYVYNGDGTIQSITVKDSNNNTVSVTTYTYVNGNVDTTVLVQNGSTVTTQYTYDGNGNLTGTVNTKS